MNNSNKSTAKKGIGFLLLAAFLYSLMPVLIRTVGGGGIPPTSQVFFRYIFACACAFLYFFFISKSTFVISRKHIIFLLFTAFLGYALANLFFTYSILNTQISNALFLFYSFAIITPIMGFIFLKDKINFYNTISLLLSFFALTLLFQPNSFGTWKIGGLFAILSAFGQAEYLIARRKLSGYPASLMMLINTVVGVISIGILSVAIDSSFYASSEITHVPINTWIISAVSGINNFLAWFCMTKGFEYFKATTGSIILLAELLFGILFAFILFKEVPTIATFIGGILILIAAVLVILKGEK